MSDSSFQQSLLEQLSVLAGPLRAIAKSEYLRNMARSIVGSIRLPVCHRCCGKRSQSTRKQLRDPEQVHRNPPQSLSDLGRHLML